MLQLELRKLVAAQQTMLAGQADADARRSGLLMLGDRMRDLNTPEQMTRAAAEVVGRTLGANRAGFGTLSSDGEYVDVYGDWTLQAAPSVAGRHRFAD
jgi:hypothetical protein